MIHADLKNSGQTRACYGKKLVDEFCPQQTLYGYIYPPGVVLVVWDARQQKFYSELDTRLWAFWNEGVSDLDLAILMTLGPVFARILNRGGETGKAKRTDNRKGKPERENAI